MKYAKMYDPNFPYRQGDVAIGAEGNPYVFWHGYWQRRGDPILEDAWGES